MEHPTDIRFHGTRANVRSATPSPRRLGYALAALCLAVISVSVADSAPGSGMPSSNPTAAATGPVTGPTDRNDARTFDCLIAPNALLDLGVEAQGVVETVDVAHGERVSKGQTLATMRAAVERASLEQALDRVSMTSEIEAREADLAFNRRVLERLESMQDQELAPQQSVDEARARHLVAEAALRRARDEARLDQHELLRREALFRQRFVVSPIDGVVVRRHAEPGELVVDAPVLTIADLDTLRVEVVLPATQLNRFAAGDVATVFPEIAQQASVDAVVMSIDPMLDAASGTFGVRLTLDNAAGAITAGQECRVRFDETAHEG